VILLRDTDAQVRGESGGHDLRQNHTFVRVARRSGWWQARGRDRMLYRMFSLPCAPAECVQSLDAPSFVRRWLQHWYASCRHWNQASPDAIWRLATAGKAAVGSGNIFVAAFDVTTKNSKRREFFMNKRTKLAIAVSAAMWMVPITRAVAGIDVAAGDWKIDFAGNVNAFYVGTSCDTPSTTTTVTGGLACVSPDHSSSIRNGLLPAALVFSGTTRQSDLDIDVTIGFYPGINSDLGGGSVNGSGNPSALQSPGIDARQVYFTFGDASWGTVKMGRDIGLFGKDAILDDMTLLGVGTALGNPAPSNTSLGRIGIGYIYTDWEPQITYTTANLAGFTGSFGIFQPMNDGTYNTHNIPQFQVGLAYAWGDPKTDALTGKVWFDLVSQKLKLANNTGAPGQATSYTGTEVDGGVKLGVAGFEGVLYGYTGKGVGTTGLFILATSASGDKRKSDGGYVQATYKAGPVKFGLSYGVSDLKLADDERPFENTSTLLKRNRSGVAGVYYSLTKSITLVGEYIDTKAEAWNGNSATQKDFALGGILFF
jgi:predicted porin